MDKIANSKNMLRKQYVSKRKNIENKKEKSKQIFNKIIETDLYKKAKIVALYKNLPSEVDTSELIEYSLKLDKIVALPRVEGDILEFYKIEKSEIKNLVKSRFGVEEPIKDKNSFIEKETIDLMIVPGVCFDREKNRMGFGKGYYDKYLENSNLKTIGICFSEQIIDKLIFTPNDIKMNLVITDTFVLT